MTHGTVEGIFVAPQAKTLPHAVTEVEAIAGIGARF